MKLIRSTSPKSFFFVIILITSQSFSQSITAGITDVDDYYHSLDPDIVLSSYVSVNDLTDHVLLDVNGDGIHDFNITTYHDNNGQWGMINHYYIEPLMNNEIAISHIDSCTAPSDSNFLKLWPMTKSYAYGETILINDDWIDSTAHLRYFEMVGWFGGGGYICDDATFGDSTSFAGVKVHTATDTLYGWIRFKKIGGSLFEIVIDDYACNTYTVSLDEINQKPTTHVFPNPINKGFTISSTTEENLLLIDLKGQVLKTIPVHSGENNIKNLNLAPGVYFLKSKTTGSTEKIIKN